ncbi:MAG: IPT/TIG domain-containing protein [Chloroflexota bacterium]|nr:IPT/TIG domain-containing protein [Chloroflexota bacterium]
MNIVHRPMSVAFAILVAILTMVFYPGEASADACTPFTAEELCVAAPAGAPADHCQELASYLLDFQQTACGIGIANPGYYPNYAAHLTLASSNMGPDLLAEWNMQNVEMELDSLTEMGVNTIAINIAYPLLTPAFHTYLNSQNSNYDKTVADYIDFYAEVIARTRARGLAVHIEHGIIFGDFAVVDPRFYFDTIRVFGPTVARQRHNQERAQESYLILTQLAPDYLTLLEEPGTLNAAFGLIDGEVLGTPVQWRDYLVSAIGLYPSHDTMLGAGAGTWDTEEYMNLFAPMPQLDYIDFHIYPATNDHQNYFETVLAWTDLVRSHDPNKLVTIGPSWMYKATAGELGTYPVISPEVLSRDVYSYWEPLDQKFLELFSHVSRAKGLTTFTPWGTWYLFSYLNYGDAILMTPANRILSNQLAAYDNMRNGIMTGTGQTYENIATATNILVVTGVTPDHGPQSGPGANQVVTITGKNFLPGSITVVKFGNMTATDGVVVDSSTITAVSPAGSGTVGVTIESPDGRTRTKPNAYVYDPPPTITSISSNSGPETGGRWVMIEGENFVTGSTDTQVLFGGIPATQVDVYPTAITAYTPPGVGLGTVDVVVTNPDLQTAVLTGGYTFVPPPTVLSVTPDSGSSTGGTQVTISGQGFFAGSSDTRVWFGNLEATDVAVLSDTQIQAVTPMGNGVARVLVLNPDFQTGELLDAFTFVYPPTLLKIVPEAGPLDGGNTVWLGGYGFQPGATVLFGDRPATVESVTPNLITVAAPSGTGQIELEVTNPDGLQGTSPVPYAYSADPPPCIVFFTPTHGPAGGGTTVYIYGQNFVPGSTSTVVRFGTQQATTVTVLTPQWIRMEAPSGTGTVNLTVINPDAQAVVSAGLYTYD